MEWGGEVSKESELCPCLFLLWFPVSHFYFITQHLDPCCSLLMIYLLSPPLSWCPITRPVSLRCHIHGAIFLLITFKDFSLLFSLLLAILQILGSILLSDIIFCNFPIPLLQFVSSLLSFYKPATFIPASNTMPKIPLLFIQMLHILQSSSLLVNLLWTLLHTWVPLFPSFCWIMANTLPFKSELCFYLFHKHASCFLWGWESWNQGCGSWFVGASHFLSYNSLKGCNS